MSVGAKDILIRELKDSLNEQRELNKTLQSALNISNIQVQELTVQVKLLNEQIDYMKRKLFGSSREKMEQQTDGQFHLIFLMKPMKQLKNYRQLKKR